jgi:(methylthio)acryloyl-CoA hydratase
VRALDSLPPTLSLTTEGGIAHVKICRAHKRNALDDSTVLGLEALFSNPPETVRVAVLSAEGDHFSAGLDLSSLAETSTFGGVAHSSMWHRAFERITHGHIPVISVLKGAVIGGGLELASATHLRVAERSAFYCLPEAQRGLFVGGGGSVRITRLIGVANMTDLMLTGRVIDAETGGRIGLSQYVVDNGEGLTKALELAEGIASNSDASNFAIINVLPRIAEMAPTEGYLVESLMAAIAQGGTEAKALLASFLDGRAPRISATGGGRQHG